MPNSSAALSQNSTQASKRYIALKLPSDMTVTTGVQSAEDIEWSIKIKDKGKTMTAWFSSPMTVTVTLPPTYGPSVPVRQVQKSLGYAASMIG